MPETTTPLRYPGGKTKLTQFVYEILKENSLLDGYYVEPFAGGAGLAINLLIKGYVQYLYLNDIDKSIYAFWHTVLNNNDLLCQYIHDVDITMDEWYKQKEIQNEKEKYDLLTLGISTFFLNRTNRSGILNAGVIGGYNQTGNYKIDARFNKKALIKKIELIAFYRSRINIFNEDAINFLDNIVSNLPEKTLVNLDPPYYVKGQQLYQNSYTHSDHEEISKRIPLLKQHWIVTYDNVEQIHDLYERFDKIDFNLSYSAQKKYRGKEILISGENVRVPVNNSLYQL